MKNTEQTALSKNIQRLCNERKMTHCELAEKAGCTSVSISRYCTGARIPKASTLQAIAKALNVRMDELMDEPDTEG